MRGETGTDTMRRGSESVSDQTMPAREHAVERCRERGITIPTIAQLRDPALIPAAIRTHLRSVDM